MLFVCCCKVMHLNAFLCKATAFHATLSFLDCVHCAIPPELRPRSDCASLVVPSLAWTSLFRGSLSRVGCSYSLGSALWFTDISLATLLPSHRRHAAHLELLNIGEIQLPSYTMVLLCACVCSAAQDLGSIHDFRGQDYCAEHGCSTYLLTVFGRSSSGLPTPIGAVRVASIVLGRGLCEALYLFHIVSGI